MVTFMSMPYSEVYNRSIIQEQILDDLEKDFSLEKAKELVYNRLSLIK